MSRARLFRPPPRFYGQPSAGGSPTGSAAAATISGTIITAATAASAPTSVVPFGFEDKILIFGLAIAAAGVGTTIDSATINGVPAFVDAQANTGGYIAAVISAPAVITPEDRIFNLRCLLSASGAAAARFYAQTFQGALSLRPIVPPQTSTTAIDTARSATTDRYRNGIVIATAINDVGAANQCIWSGTIGASEQDDAAVGTARASFARGLNIASDVLGGTVISTFDVISTTGISLAVATYR